MRIGTAHTVINNEIGTDIQAATHLRKVAGIRDDLEANALWIESGEQSLLVMSCDLVGLDIRYVNQILPELAEAAGVAEERILIGTTHTHTGPAILGPSSPRKPVDTAYLDRLRGWLAELCKEAVASAEEGEIAWGVGAAQLGYNRRVCWQDGTHTMHGDTTRPDFRGLEGDADPQHTAIFARARKGPLRAVLYNNTTHPTSFYGRDFLSADWPGLMRKWLRELYGDVAVLYINGTSGDISQESQLAPQGKRRSAEEKIARNAHLAMGETLRLLHLTEYQDEVELRHRRQAVQMRLRELSPERLAWAQEVLREYDRTDELNLQVATAWQTVLFHEQFGDRDTETIHIHAGAIDELSFVTAPCELFTHFGRRIKARSPFGETAIFGHMHGFMGYCPTTEGAIGGGWGGDPTWSVRWEDAAGYRFVDEAVNLLYSIR